MENAITYTQFVRVDNLIQRKNEQVIILFNAYLITMFVSLFGPGMFFVTLKPTGFNENNDES